MKAKTNTDCQNGKKRRKSRPWKRGTAEVQEHLRIRAIKIVIEWPANGGNGGEWCCKARATTDCCA